MGMQTRRSSRLMIADKEGRLSLFSYKDEHQSPFWATLGGELKPGGDYEDVAIRELGNGAKPVSFTTLPSRGAVRPSGCGVSRPSAPQAYLPVR